MNKAEFKAKYGNVSERPARDRCLYSSKTVIITRSIPEHLIPELDKFLNDLKARDKKAKQTATDHD